MKDKIFQLLILFSTLIPFLGCEDVIEIDLNSADPKIVIEGVVSNDGSPSQVRITRSTDFYEPGIYEKVSGAEVEIIDSEGKSAILTEVSDGLYETNSVLGEIGRTYFITVKTDGDVYDAESTIPPQITLDSLKLEVAPYPPGGEVEENKRYFLHFYFQDLPDNEDFCRFKILNNGKSLGGFRIYMDKYTNGNYIKSRLNLSAEENDIKIGDELTVELLSIDKAAYDYYFTANSVNASRTSGSGGPPSSIAPANPVTNWTNDALGLFSAHSISTQTIRVEE
ncbi:MAG: DUF4249 domain-containing protein [Bacteroidota bacterium]